LLLFAGVQRTHGPGQPATPKLGDGQRAKAGVPMALPLFGLGYLTVWIGFSLCAALAQEALHHAALLSSAMSASSPRLAGAILIAAGLYQLTPYKGACLTKCRSPLGFLLGSWKGGWSGALRMGAKNGAWCVGCCWALMASLFALGVMSIAWTAFVAALIAVEKLLPWRRVATYGTAAVLLALGLFVLIAPSAVPGLTIPDTSPMPMGHMGM